MEILTVKAIAGRTKIAVAPTNPNSNPMPTVVELKSVITVMVTDEAGKTPKLYKNSFGLKSDPFVKSQVNIYKVTRRLGYEIYDLYLHVGLIGLLTHDLALGDSFILGITVTSYGEPGGGGIKIVKNPTPEVDHEPLNDLVGVKGFESTGVGMVSVKIPTDMIPYEDFDKL